MNIPDINNFTQQGEINSVPLNDLLQIMDGTNFVAPILWHQFCGTNFVANFDG